MLDLFMKNWKLRVWCSLFHFFHVICKISNFNMWTAKHLAQASCTGLTLGLELKQNLPPPIPQICRSSTASDFLTTLIIWAKRFYSRIKSVTLNNCEQSTPRPGTQTQGTYKFCFFTGGCWNVTVRSYNNTWIDQRSWTTHLEWHIFGMAFASNQLPAQALKPKVHANSVF